MGQQQLLLLVLSTVIVGLATVAGIQAFSENQAQSSQDALVQRGTSIASDIKGLQGRPTQMGGIDLNGGDSDIAGGDVADALGYDHDGSGVVDAEGAGASGECDIQDASGGTVKVLCTSDDSPQAVTVGYDPSEDPEVQTDFTDSGAGTPFST
jgi:hypothetical protein